MNVKTGECDHETPWNTNLVLDIALNKWAAQTGGVGVQSFPSSFVRAHVGSSTTPVKIASGAVTGTQSASTTVTSSGSFFTAAMVGSLLKWGTGSAGQEMYITAFTSSTQVTVDTSATHTAEVFTVWNVQQTTMGTPLFTTETYQTVAGDCFTTITNNVAVMQRTYIVGNQASNYTVNEVGWGPTATATVLGRYVLTSSVVVTPSNFLLVVIELTFTMTPATPTAVSDVGTNINTAGNAAIERLCISRVGTNGFTNADTGNGDVLFGTNSNSRLLFFTATYSQRANPSETVFTPPTNLDFGLCTPTYSGTRGVVTVNRNSSLVTSGQSLFGLGLSNTNSGLAFDVKFTTTQTAPTGTFQPNTTFTVTFNRVLTN